ncbi:hypothetical protein [Arthrobacter sp. 260]|uniref:hypothetical protein n=1 Tax=Arthrobacter sp. 260 TaxID=2735314 RepID=UPI001490D9B1|nr:hypothetical protein [Arthrobacter sp. 260]NOJ60193.1 hypothetical protein [Arthrobacter sp. 260]
MKYRDPKTPARNVLAGSDQDLDRLRTLAEQTLDQHPVSAPGVERIRQDLLSATQDARRDYERVATATPLRPGWGGWTGRDLLVASVHSLVFFAVASFAFVLLPTRFNRTSDLGSMLTWSTNSGYVAVAVIIVALLLPRAPIKDLTRQLAGFSLLQVAFIAVGLAYGGYLSTFRDDAAEAGWTPWLVSNLVVVVMLLALAAKGYASARHWSPARGRKTMEGDYRAAIHGAKREAVDRLETLLRHHPQDRLELEQKWRNAVQRLVRERRISRRAAANAKVSTPWRWQLEAAASPRYRAPETQTLND